MNRANADGGTRSAENDIDAPSGLDFSVPHSAPSQPSPALSPAGRGRFGIESRSSFIETSESATRLVLSDENAAGVAVRWHVAPRDLKYLRGAFPHGTNPTPLIRLLRLNESGASEPLECLPVSDTNLLSGGEAGFAPSGAGFVVQAELGLETPTGGWLLLARSNPLEVTADSTAKSPAVIMPEFDPLRVEPALAATVEDLSPIFPEIPAVPPAVAACVPVVEPDVGPEELLSTAHPSVHDVAFSAEQSRSSSYAISEPRYGEDAESVEVYAELLVHGRAKPGSAIDLFGHRIRIGSGGRFSLRLPVSNSQLLEQALNQGLPLAISLPSDS